jgi:hypothetical protein
MHGPSQAFGPDKLVQPLQIFAALIQTSGPMHLVHQG